MGSAPTTPPSQILADPSKGSPPDAPRTANHTDAGIRSQLSPTIVRAGRMHDPFVSLESEEEEDEEEEDEEDDNGEHREREEQEAKNKDDGAKSN